MSLYLKVLFAGMFFILPGAIVCQQTEQKAMLIDDDKPSAYITFEKSGVGTAGVIYAKEDKNRIWLRLHNNTILKLFVCSFQLPPDDGEYGIELSVKRIDERPSSLLNQFGYEGIDTCLVRTIESGKSVLFSVPRGFLAKDLKIEMQIYYGWRNDWHEDLSDATKTFVTFENTELPQAEREKLDK